MHKSLKIRNLNYLRAWYEINPDKFINGGEMERKAQEIGYKASNCSRRLRELADEGLIERKIMNGTVWYRYLPQPEIQEAQEIALIFNGQVV